tara:strand:- start:168 stop:377 length:210 start_codon:yes stop_codon:yes gene_type:complete
MKIKVNGEVKDLISNHKDMTLDETINILGYKKNTIIVELNSKIISNQSWENKFLKDGDKIEIVSIVGGG